MSNNTFPDPIAVWNSPQPVTPLPPNTITLPHQPAPYYPIASIQTETLRIELAKAALQGFCASIRPDQVWSHDEMATTCFRLADAMLKAMEAKP